MINNLSQLSQIVVNVLFFQTACSDLETLLVTLRCVSLRVSSRSALELTSRLRLPLCSATQRGGTIHLDSLASFQHTLTLTQDRIVANISQKMDSFFEEAEYNWLAPQPPQNNEASGYLQDLIDFLSTVMMSVLIQLPEFSKDYVYRGALSHCAMLLMVSLSPSRASSSAR
jgi:exocyst complex component 6